MAQTIKSIEIVADPDEYPDLSFLGEYKDDPTDGCICCCCGEFLDDVDEDHEIPCKGRLMRFFVPYAGGEEIDGPNYKEYGKHDFQRMESYNRGFWHMLHVYAKAVIECDHCSHPHEELSAGLSGVENDSSKGYLAEVASEELEEMKATLEQDGVDMSNFEELKAGALDDFDCPESS